MEQKCVRVWLPKRVLFFFYNGVNLSSGRILQQEFFGPTWQPPHIKSRVLGVTQRVHVQLSACASFKRVKLIHTIVKKIKIKTSQWSQFDVFFLIGHTTEDKSELHMIEFIQKIIMKVFNCDIQN